MNSGREYVQYLLGLGAKVAKKTLRIGNMLHNIKKKTFSDKAFA